MIGVVGPRDSVELVERVARSEGLDSSMLVSRSYKRVEEAIDLARKLDSMCHVLLFTGLVPYKLALQAEDLHSPLIYIPHSVSDLYRALVRVLRHEGGRMPVLSFDTVDEAVISEVCTDLGLTCKDYFFPLDISSDEIANDLTASSKIAELHAHHYRAGEVEACLTCLHSVDEYLGAEGIPSWRIYHTPSTIRSALREARLTVHVRRSQAMQTAEGLIEIPALSEDGARAGNSRGAQRLRARVREALRAYERQMRGTLALLNDTTFVMHTTRGVIENALLRLRNKYKSPIRPGDLPSEANIGYGLGFSVASAMERASKALLLAREHGSIHIAFEDGTILNVDAPADEAGKGSAKGESPMSPTIEAFGLGSLALRRLIAALRHVDCEAVTARVLAEAYGIETRSARRILSLLERAGVAVPVPTVRSAGSGRPPKVCRIDFDQLVAAMHPGTELPGRRSP